MSDISKRARSALAEVRKYNVHPRLDVIAAALDRLGELQSISCPDGECLKCSYCEDTEAWNAGLGKVKAERDRFRAKLEAIHLELSLRTGLSGDNALTMVQTLAVERDALKARVKELEDGFFGRMAALLRTERDQLRADALAHMELAGQLRARVAELEAELNSWKADDAAAWDKCEERRAQLVEADRLIQTVLNDVERCKQNNVVWPSTVRMLKAHLAKEGGEPLGLDDQNLQDMRREREAAYMAKKVIRRADTPESACTPNHCEAKEGGELPIASTTCNECGIPKSFHDNHGYADCKLPWGKVGRETEPAKKVIRRADTPESRAFWAHAEKSEKEDGE